MTCEFALSIDYWEARTGTSINTALSPYEELLTQKDKQHHIVEAFWSEDTSSELKVSLFADKDLAE